MIERQNVMITGGGGFVGRGVIGSLPKNDKLNLFIPTRTEVDILNPKQTSEYIDANHIDTIWHFAAQANVDGAQRDEQYTYRVNLHATRDMAKEAEKRGIHFIFASTDFVFPGTIMRPGPYTPNSLTAKSSPEKIGVYANSKLLAEKAIAGIGGAWTIVRIANPFWNLDPDKDYLGKLLKFVKNGYPIATDQTVTPTYLPDFTNALYEISVRHMTGKYHIAASINSETKTTTPYEITKKLVKKTRMSCTIFQGLIVDYLKKPGVSPRPVHGGLTPSDEFEVTSLDHAINRVVSY